MTTVIPLPIPDDVYQQLQEIAASTQRNVSDLLLEAITNAYAPFPVDSRRAQMRKEEAAYQAMHTHLQEKYQGQHVAIYEGQVVDVAEDLVTLIKRVRQTLPNQVVLFQKVETSPEPVLRVRHPRIVRQTQ